MQNMFAQIVKIFSLTCFSSLIIVTIPSFLTFWDQADSILYVVSRAVKIIPINVECHRRVYHTGLGVLAARMFNCRKSTQMKFRSLWFQEETGSASDHPGEDLETHRLKIRRASIILNYSLQVRSLLVPFVHATQTSRSAKGRFLNHARSACLLVELPAKACGDLSHLSILAYSQVISYMGSPLSDYPTF